MRRSARILTALAVVALALAPAFAEARPGGSVSSGSRGSRTFNSAPSTQTAPRGSQQFDRTQSAPSAPSNPGFGAGAQSRPAAAQGGGFFSRNPLMTGIMGGLLGAGLFGLLGGHGLFGGLGGMAGVLGLLVQIALIGGVIWLVMRMFASRRPAVANANMGFNRDLPVGNQRPAMAGGGMGAGMGGGMAMNRAAPVQTREIQIGESDFQAFEQALVAVNAAWSRQDLQALRRISTAEMTNYFAGDLNDLRARGWTNQTSDVRLEAGDLSEAWQENGQDYATVAMRFSLIDVTRDASGRVVEGNPSVRETVTEMWTFVRAPGEPWQVSAIQQTN